MVFHLCRLLLHRRLPIGNTSIVFARLMQDLHLKMTILIIICETNFVLLHKPILKNYIPQRKHKYIRCISAKSTYYLSTCCCSRPITGGYDTDARGPFVRWLEFRTYGELLRGYATLLNARQCRPGLFQSSAFKSSHQIKFP